MRRLQRNACIAVIFLIYRIVQQLSAIVIQNYHVSLPLFFVSKILIMLSDWKFVKILPFFGFLCFVIASVHKFDMSGYLHGNFVLLNVSTGTGRPDISLSVADPAAIN